MRISSNCVNLYYHVSYESLTNKEYWQFLSSASIWPLNNLFVIGSKDHLLILTVSLIVIFTISTWKKKSYVILWWYRFSSSLHMSSYIHGCCIFSVVWWGSYHHPSVVTNTWFCDQNCSTMIFYKKIWWFGNKCITEIPRDLFTHTNDKTTIFITSVHYLI